MKIGLIELGKSAKGTLAVLVLGCATYGLVSGHLDGGSYAAVISVVSAIFFHTRTKMDMAAMNK